MPLPIMDKKYRNTIPSLVKDMPFHLLSEDDGASFLASRTKIRRSRKNKIGKNGIYPNEEANIAKWWTSKDVSSVVCDTLEAREECTRTILLEQRSRETELQVILILETLSLEALTPISSISLNASESREFTTKGDKEIARKPKKPQNLENLLDLLIDRLSIWQSVTVEGEKSGEGQAARVEEEDKKVNHLDQFCVDIIIPL